MSRMYSLTRFGAEYAVLDQQRGFLSSKPTIAIVEAGPTPRVDSVRIARAFARGSADPVLLCHWHRLQFEQGNVTVSGSAYLVAGSDQLTQVTIEPHVPLKSIFFDAPGSGYLTPQDATARNRLAAAGIESSGSTVFTLLERMMLEASHRGVVSNALGGSRVWGPKHLQELQLRRYEAASGETIPRPKTYIARPHEFRYVLSLFAQRCETCVVKPSFGGGGLGIAILRPGEFCAIPIRTVVVQRLIPAPLVLEGNKADIRFYLLIRTDQEAASSLVGPILLRRAATHFRAESVAAEITNTAYRLRCGLPPDVRLLETASSVIEHTKTQIVAQVHALARALIRAFFWNASNARMGGDLVPNRLLLFGVDALVSVSEAQPRLYYLECNPFPLLFRGLPDCDAAMEEMLTYEYLPALTGSGAAPNRIGNSP